MTNIEELREMIGQDWGHTPWLELTQDRITAFGGITLDFDPHHIDPMQAAKGPFGKPAAQGFLTLSLLTHFIENVPLKVEFHQNINYGLNRVRFIAPALVNDKLRAEFTLQDVAERKPGELLMTLAVTVVIDGKERPAMTAEWLVLITV